MRPRIRSLKPEAIRHRKIGPLPDREFRLWIGMLTLADDEGRLVADDEQLRVEVFGYHQKVTGHDIDKALTRLDKDGLIRLYKVEGTVYAMFPSWHDHQRINRPTPSCLPPAEQGSPVPGSSESAPVTPLAVPPRSPARTAYSDDFERFWDAYPKRIGKSDAFRAWVKIAPDEPLMEKMGAAIQRGRLSKQWRDDDGKYIPSPSTFLNQGRWDDDPRVR